MGGGPRIVILGTCDSKLDELLFLRDRILEHKDCSVLLVDVGRTLRTHELIDMKNIDLLNRVAEEPSERPDRDLPSDRAEYIKHMIPCASHYVAELYSSVTIHGIISAGGSSGTSLATAVMRDVLPFGFPKLMVSTMASGDIRPFIGSTDITMMYSVVDIAGINSLLGHVLSNAAGAIRGMASSYMARLERPIIQPKGKRVGLTMFGVTTKCVDAVRIALESKYNYEVFVFHATGTGGRAMEQLIKEGKIDAVLDITTTEIADEVVGGVLTAGPDRLAAAAKAGIPQVISVGACDMVNFGPRDSVPSKFGGRLLVQHNPAVTLMRTTSAECMEIGNFIARQLCKHAKKPNHIEIIVPAGGFSSLSNPGMEFYDIEADFALLTALESGLQSVGIKVMRKNLHINDLEFSTILAESLAAAIQRQGS